MMTTSSIASGRRPASTAYWDFSSSSLFSSGVNTFIRRAVVFIMVSWIPVPDPIMFIMSAIPEDSITVDGLTCRGFSRSMRYSSSGVLYSYRIPETYRSISLAGSSSQVLKPARSFSVTPLIQELISWVMRLPEYTLPSARSFPSRSISISPAMVSVMSTVRSSICTG